MKKNIKKFLLLPLLFLLMFLTAFPLISNTNVKALETRSQTPFQTLGTRLFYRESLEETVEGYVGSCSFVFLIPTEVYDSNSEIGYFFTSKKLVEENNVTGNYYARFKQLGLRCSLNIDTDVEGTPSPFENAYVCMLKYHFSAEKLHEYDVGATDELFVCAAIRQKGASDDAWVYSDPLTSSAYGSVSNEIPDNKPGNDKNSEQNVPVTDGTEDSTMMICGIPAKTFLFVGVCVFVVVVCICVVAIKDKKR